MSAAELARKLDVPTNRVTSILNGQRAITGDTALRLAHFFGTSPEFWLNLLSLYELRIAQKKLGKSIRALPQLNRSLQPVERRPSATAEKSACSVWPNGV
jgi:antitoxin HigA-1